MTARMLAAGAVLGLWAADAAAQWGNTTGVPGRPGGVHGAGARNRFDIDPWPAGPAIGRPGFGRPGFGRPGGLGGPVVPGAGGRPGGFGPAGRFNDFAPNPAQRAAGVGLPPGPSMVRPGDRDQDESDRPRVQPHHLHALVHAAAARPVAYTPPPSRASWFARAAGRVRGATGAAVVGGVAAAGAAAAAAGRKKGGPGGGPTGGTT